MTLTPSQAAKFYSWTPQEQEQGLQYIKQGYTFADVGSAVPEGADVKYVGQVRPPGRNSNNKTQANYGGNDSRLMYWKAKGQQQEQAAAPAPAPAAPAPPPATLQLEATLASNQAAMDAARTTYAKQNEELTGTVRGLQDLLLKTRSESDAAIKSQELAFQTSTKNQELAFQTAMQKQELAFQTAMQKQELTLNNYMTGIPVAERSAVAPKLGDTRTGGRNAAANTLSQLRIIAPSLLGITDQSGSLGRL
jgi:hypothetical protein